MTAFLLAVVGLGLAGLDPAGALIVVAALAAGAHRRAVLGSPQPHWWSRSRSA